LNLGLHAVNLGLHIVNCVRRLHLKSHYLVVKGALIWALVSIRVDFPPTSPWNCVAPTTCRGRHTCP
jgi:hypothetical protein